MRHAPSTRRGRQDPSRSGSRSSARTRRAVLPYYRRWMKPPTDRWRQRHQTRSSAMGGLGYYQRPESARRHSRSWRGKRLPTQRPNWSAYPRSGATGRRSPPWPGGTKSPSTGTPASWRLIDLRGPRTPAGDRRIAPTPRPYCARASLGVQPVADGPGCHDLLAACTALPLLPDPCRLSSLRSGDTESQAGSQRAAGGPASDRRRGGRAPRRPSADRPPTRGETPGRDVGVPWRKARER
jgi:hypothetical protein